MLKVKEDPTREDTQTMHACEQDLRTIHCFWAMSGFQVLTEHVTPMIIIVFVKHTQCHYSLSLMQLFCSQVKINI